MIFVTVGEQLPFDRLVRTVDEWAAESGKQVFAQIGNSELKPSHIEYKRLLDPNEFRNKMLSAEIVVAHAGMGTIISAMEMGKPILIMPRKSSLGEHRNDHQTATASRFLALNYVSVAFDETELAIKLAHLDEVLNNHTERALPGPNPLLIQTSRNCIEKK